MKHLKIDTPEGDSIEIILLQNGEVEIQIDEPWAGDSESGFGRTTRICLEPQQQIILKDFLNKLT